MPTAVPGKIKYGKTKIEKDDERQMIPNVKMSKSRVETRKTLKDNTDDTITLRIKNVTAKSRKNQPTAYTEDVLIVNRDIMESIGSSIQSMNQFKGSILGSSYDCTERFKKLYEIKQTPYITILSLHVKYALKVLDVTTDEQMILSCLLDIYNRLPIKREITSQNNLSNLLIIEPEKSQGILLARVITVFQTITLKMLSQCDIKSFEIDTGKLVGTFDPKVPGSIISWCDYLPIFEKDTRLCTISKIAYGLSTKFLVVHTDLLLSSVHIWQFQVNCKRLKTVISKIGSSKFASSYHQSLISTLKHIQESNDRPLTEATMSLVDNLYKVLEGASFGSLLPTKSSFMSSNEPRLDDKITDPYRRKAISLFKTYLTANDSPNGKIESIIIKARNCTAHMFELGTILQDLIKKTEKLNENFYQAVQLFIETLVSPNIDSALLSFSSTLANNAAAADRDDCYYVKIMKLSTQLDQAIFQSCEELEDLALKDMTNRILSLSARCVKLKKPEASMCLLFACQIISRSNIFGDLIDPEDTMRDKQYEKLMMFIAQYCLSVDSGLISSLTDLNISKTVICYICASVLILLRKSRNTKKEQLSKHLLDYVFETFDYRRQPLQCSKMLIYYYYSNKEIPEEYLTAIPELKDILSQKTPSYMMIACLQIISCEISKTTDLTNLHTTTNEIVESIGNYLDKNCTFSAVFLRLIESYHESLATSGCYALQCKLMTVAIQAQNAPYNLVLELAEAQMNCGRTGSARSTLDQNSGYRANSDSPEKSIEFARSLLIRTEISLMEHDIQESRHYLIMLFDHLKSLNLITSGNAIRNADESLSSLHPKALIFFKSVIASCKFALLMESVSLATDMGNALIRFISAYIKGMKQQENEIDMASTITCLIKAATIIGNVYERMGLIALSNSRLKLSLKLENPKDKSASLLAYRWSGSLYAESNFRQEQPEEGEKTIDRMVELYDSESNTELDVHFYERIHAYLIADRYRPDQKHCSQVKEYFEQSLQLKSLVDEMNGLSLGNDLERGLIRAQAKAALAYLNSKSENESTQKLLTNSQQLTTRLESNSISPESIQFQMRQIRQKYEAAIAHLNSNPRYTGIDSDLVLAIPFAAKPLKRDLKAIKLISEADSLLKDLHMLTLNECSFTEIEECSMLATDIAFVHHALSRGSSNLRYPFCIHEVSRDLPYSIERENITATEDIELPTKHELMQWDKRLLESIRIVEAFDHNNLPENWTVVSFAYQKHTQALVVTRYEKGQEPFSLRLPKYINRDHDYDEDRFTLKQGLEMLRTIVEDANAKVEKPLDEITQEDKEEWWSVKYDGEMKMSQLLKSAAYIWFGGFKAIFGSSQIKMTEEFVKKFNEIMAKYLPSRQKRNGSKSANSKSVEIDESIYRLFAMANTTRTNHNESEEADELLIEDLVRFLLDMLLSQGEKNPYDELDIDQMIVELEELVQTVECPNNQEHMILVIDNICHEFPWESLPFLIDKEITRVPSLGVLQRMLDNTADCLWPVKSAFYIVDPGNDLKNTQKRISQGIDHLQEHDESVDWTGMIGEIPTEEHIIHQIQKCDIYLYMGHGGGQEYIRRTAIERVAKCPPVMLFGCRSNDLQRQGEYESAGNHLSYLSAGCPMLLCTLFTVTDKDTDHHTMRILHDWMNNDRVSKSSTIVSCLSRSRQKMKLPYLNGAAFVVYGLPLRVKK